jgi:hypothetical protein
LAERGGERPRIVDKVAIDDDPEVEAAAVAHDGDVETDAVHDG